MKHVENNKPLTAGEQKIEEYVTRINNGESKESIFDGLPTSFKSAIEQKLHKSVAKEIEQEVPEIPPQYTGFDSETIDLLWTPREYISDPQKTEAEQQKKAQVLAFLREKESIEKGKADRQQVDQKKIAELRDALEIPKPQENTPQQEKQRPASLSNESPLLTLEERKKLHGWTASYELAKVAKQQNVDLSQMSREEYVTFAIQNSLAIDDTQLRTAPWQRMATSVGEIVLANRERKARITEETDSAFTKFCYDMKQKAEQENRFLAEKIRVRQGTKDSSSWLFFGINSGLGENNLKTPKAYISVKDLNTLTPERFITFMTALRDANYNGDIKIFQDVSGQGINLNDQIVMHGNSQEDAEKALVVAEQFFGEDLDQKSIGKDAVIDGENMSYSQILAKKIKDALY